QHERFERSAGGEGEVIPRRRARGLSATLALAVAAAHAQAQYEILPDESVARNWSEAMIEALRHDAGQVAVNARNVFHFGIAVYDAWAVHDPNARPYLFGETVSGFECPYDHSADRIGSRSAQEVTISYAAYRLLRHR